MREYGDPPSFRHVKEDDFHYAIENTRVILAPDQQIATFGSTSFNFYLISELMDRVDQVRVRNGKIHAERPQILTPEHYCRLLLEGFGEKAERYVDQLREHARKIAVLRYGFQFRKTDVTEKTTRDSLDAVIERTKSQVERSAEPSERSDSRRRRRMGSLLAEIHDRHDRAFLRR